MLVPIALVLMFIHSSYEMPIPDDTITVNNATKKDNKEDEPKTTPPTDMTVFVGTVSTTLAPPGVTPAKPSTVTRAKPSEVTPVKSGSVEASFYLKCQF